MSWVGDQYKLISIDDGNTFELYDLINDPEEANDIFFNEMEIAYKMQKELSGWMESVNYSQNGGDY